MVDDFLSAPDHVVKGAGAIHRDQCGAAFLVLDAPFFDQGGNILPTKDSVA